MLRRGNRLAAQDWTDDSAAVNKLNDTIAAVLARAPDWIRNDLAARDATTRERAEETLAAMIAAALDKVGEFRLRLTSAEEQDS
jgi:hypothetical protein